VTVVAQCSTGTYSAGDSFVEVQSTSANADDNTDDVSSVADGSKIYLAVAANDVYGNDVPLGTWVASATNGALVGIGTSTDPACGATSVASTSAAGTNIHVSVCQGTDYKAQSTVLTLTYGTTEIAKKSLLITGDVAKLEVSSVGSPKNTGSAQYKVFKTRTFDAAGNQIAWGASSITADSATLNQDVIALDGGATVADDYASNANTATCSSGSKGKAAVRLKALTNTLTYVYSDVFTIQCAGTVYSYTASLDKASYVPGDIATLTISAKDVNGLPVHTLGYTANDGSTGATRNLLGGTTLHSIAGSQMDVVTAPAAGDMFGAGGVKTYQFKVGSTEGSYAMSVSLPDYASTAPAVTVQYAVKASTATVTNAEVLKSIVALIASINKQIQALQKLILRR
jgi:trimeric autotransporter adhesin